ncbi:DUF4166 domain-containing protein [Nesterenkonia rhizosphaerae]|uniref:DUF4166 domain-containing protein n=1 Tax=Nesterenkonia rhizosphaerae TaxID=1348272 RepID=A0ABP9FPW7_9MICC
MTAIFEAAMGEQFQRLHPQIRRRFAVSEESGQAFIGTGVMEQIWHRSGWVKPFLALGSTRHILAPKRGTNVPFRIENIPYTDSLGRSTVSFVRTFEYPGAKPARFDAQMVQVPGTRQVVDYLGTHQHLVTPLDFHAAPDGSLTIRSGALRFLEGPVKFTFPSLMAADAVITDSYDDAAECFRIDVQVINRQLGPLFGYRGWFTGEFRPLEELTARIEQLRPRRETARR